jgi:hypothetical protein
MRTIAFGLLILPTFMLLSGCGTSSYEEKMEKAASGLSSSSKFQTDLGAEVTIPGTEVSVRIPLPKGADSKPNEMQPMDINDAVRGKCPLFDIPGLKATYEGSIDDGKGKQCFYLSIAVSEPGLNSPTPLKGWVNELSTKFPNAADSNPNVNENYMAKMEGGGTVKWEEIHYKCGQKFFYPTADKPNNVQEFIGIIWCLSRVENGKVVTLIFRYPESLKDLHGANFDSDWLNLAAGCVKVGGGG